MGEIHILSIILVNLTLMTVLVGFFRVMMNGSRTAFHLSFSIILVTLAYVLRADWWHFHSYIRVYLSIDFDIKQNIVFNLIATWGAMHTHYALYLMIPENERKKWYVLLAWTYPPIQFFKKKIKEMKE